MSGEITSVQQQAYFCTTKAKQIKKKNVFMAAGRTGIGNLSFFFPFCYSYEADFGIAVFKTNENLF